MSVEPREYKNTSVYSRRIGTNYLNVHFWYRKSADSIDHAVKIKCVLNDEGWGKGRLLAS